MKYYFWIFLIVFLPIAFHGVGENIGLNHYAIQTSKNVLCNSSRINSKKEIYFPENIDSVRVNWLNIILLKNSSQEHEFDRKVEKIITHSPLYMRMLRILYPTDQILAQLAVDAYPMETIPLYWLSECMGVKTTPEKKPIFEKILAINPKDGVAWRYLGIIFIAEKNIPAAIDAHIKSCNNGDPGVNGCYNAGRLFEQEGQFEEAIYYYRLSRWKPSQEAANRLEAELSSQNP